MGANGVERAGQSSPSHTHGLSGVAGIDSTTHRRSGGSGMLQRLTSIIILASLALAIVSAVHTGEKALAVLFDTERLAAVATSHMRGCGLH